MITDQGIRKSLSDLIERLAKAPKALSPYTTQALYCYLLELLDEQVLEPREYSLLSGHVCAAFLDAENLNEPPNRTNGQLLHITEAVELEEKISAVSTVDQEAECECDIGVFIDRVHREVKLGLTEEIELDFYRRWMSRVLFSRDAKWPSVGL